MVHPAQIHTDEIDGPPGRDDMKVTAPFLIECVPIILGFTPSSDTSAL